MFLLACVALVATGPASLAQDTSVRQKQFNLKKGLALQGYDPVSYQHGGPKKGKSSLSLKHQGVTYHFSSSANRQRFQENPARYEPAYGGWCAWAMLDGEKVKINPSSYKVVGGKTHLFYDGLLGDTRKRWNDKKDDRGQAARAQAKWRRFVGS